MASDAAMPLSPRTAARLQSYGEPRVVRRPGAGVALRDLATGLNSADLHYLFDRYGEARANAALHGAWMMYRSHCRAQLTVAEVRGDEGMLWYEDERDAEWVVDKLEGACER